MSRRVVVVFVVLGIAVPYCALGVGLWLSRGPTAPMNTYIRLILRPITPKEMREVRTICAAQPLPGGCDALVLKRSHP